jgi:LuxR family maltose regulon positive regulatory protein
VATGAMDSRGMQLPVAWLSLDEHDNDPGRFGTYLLAALSRIDIYVDASQFASPASVHPPLDLLITALISQVEEIVADPDSKLRAGFVLVFDDHQQIVEQAVHATLGLPSC